MKENEAEKKFNGYTLIHLKIIVSVFGLNIIINESRSFISYDFFFIYFVNEI